MKEETSALQFIANYNKNFGNPGLVYTLQVLDEQFATLTATEKMLLCDFKEEMQTYLLQQQ